MNASLEHLFTFYCLLMRFALHCERIAFFFEKTKVVLSVC